jgi:uncharacterized protein with PQ loop repeat
MVKHEWECMDTIELIGWVGGVLFAFCGLPQAIHSWKMKNSDGMTYTFILMWGMGEVLTLIYVMQKADVAPLLFNYIANLCFLIVILWFKLRPSYSEEGGNG